MLSKEQIKKQLERQGWKPTILGHVKNFGGGEHRMEFGEKKLKLTIQSVPYPYIRQKWQAARYEDLYIENGKLQGMRPA